MLLLLAVAVAAETVTTADGRTVRLNDDGTWTTIAKPPPTAAPTDGGPSKWRIVEIPSKMDDTVMVTLRGTSIDTWKDGMGRLQKASIAIVCGRVAFAGLYPGGMVSSDYEDGRTVATFRTRVDDREAVKWSGSVVGDDMSSITVDNWRKFADTLGSGGDKMLVEWSAYRAGLPTATFDLAGVQEPLQRAVAACRGK